LGEVDLPHPSSPRHKASAGRLTKGRFTVEPMAYHNWISHRTCRPLLALCNPWNTICIGSARQFCHPARRIDYLFAHHAFHYYKHPTDSNINVAFKKITIKDVL
jgi:hypothetical protein